MDAADLLVASAADYWSRVTGHPFLTAVASGRLDARAFARWVAADYTFNLDYLKFGAGLLAIAPDLPACRVLGAHLQITQAVVDLLIDTAAQHKVDLDVEPGPFTLGLNSYLRALLPRGYEVSLVAMYCCERVYFDAWSAVAPQASRHAPYWPLIEHLSSDDFQAGLNAIAALVNEVAGEGPSSDMEAVFEMVVRFELLFWSEVYVGESW